MFLQFALTLRSNDEFTMRQQSVYLEVDIFHSDTPEFPVKSNSLYFHVIVSRFYSLIIPLSVFNRKYILGASVHKTPSLKSVKPALQPLH